jgi:hypothetical protein
MSSFVIKNSSFQSVAVSELAVSRAVVLNLVVKGSVVMGVPSCSLAWNTGDKN